MLNTTTKESDSPYLTWTNELAIGHALIDADHQHIFDIANRLQAEISDAETAEPPEYSIVGEVLVELIEHTGGHFMREEALMQTIGYPLYEAHKREHDMLMEKVNHLHRQFMDGQNNLALEVSEFLRKWLVRHIFNSDMELGRSVRAHE
ncbi:MULTISPECIES: bacteriohemerythrin [Oxalobacteraceae]|jgi:hemerythrin|uniref:bacteriohemerythrin n=1 Tax=Oxalobacteraceae TaxID=75682 RepID=UPI0010A2B7F7|nr:MULTISPECIES: bacteriohemerythrin [Oxalobacteraceae]